MINKCDLSKFISISLINHGAIMLILNILMYIIQFKLDCRKVIKTDSRK